MLKIQSQLLDPGLGLGPGLGLDNRTWQGDHRGKSQGLELRPHFPLYLRQADRDAALGGAGCWGIWE